jgi:glycosyltransferase involved in cell wall biosynthesis
MFSWIGFNKKEILYDRDSRVAGSSKWNYVKLFNFAIDGITSFTTAPLRISSYMGFIVSFIAFIYILYLVIRTIFFGSDLAGYPSMMAVILFLGGVQLISIGIIGEYIGRIFNETKRRPLYFVEEYHSERTSKKARR